MLKRSTLFFAFVLKQALSAHWLGHSGRGAGWDGWSEVAEGWRGGGLLVRKLLSHFAALKQPNRFILLRSAS